MPTRQPENSPTDPAKNALHANPPELVSTWQIQLEQFSRRLEELARSTAHGAIVATIAGSLLSLLYLP